MKLYRTEIVLSSVAALTFGLLPTVAQAQIVPDSSLPVNSIVAPNGNVFTIDGGTQAGGNLFHSFQDFSLPTGTEAFFKNSLDVQNIFSRVTGGNISNIDGLIRANGGASLFLLNPNGIVFGPNARLDIGGSFVGSTAESVVFQDGMEYSASDPATVPLLIVSVPIGLQFGQNPGGITVRGSGHRTVNSVFTPMDLSLNPTGLRVEAGQMLALLGGRVDFVGGIVAADGGHVEVGSVLAGEIGLNRIVYGWVGDYSAIAQFQDIHLTQQSLLDASGNGGSIQVRGRQIDLTEGAAMLLQNTGSQSGGGISVGATESLTLRGNTPDLTQGSFIRSENLGSGSNGAVEISTGELSLQNGSTITTRTFSNTDSSPISIDATGSIEIDGFALADPTRQISSISTNTFGVGNAGNLNLSSENLTVSQGGVITTSSFGSGNAGDLTLSSKNLTLSQGGVIVAGSFNSGQAGTLRIHVEDQIEISGPNPVTFISSGISSTPFGSGDARDVSIHTSRLVLREGGTINSSTVASGAAGNVTINASEFVDIEGRSSSSILSSRISAKAEILDPGTQALFGLPAIPTGDAGDLTIDTPSLRIADEALVSVGNDGPGRSGNLRINANEILLENQGRITATTASGDGGNIRLSAIENLQMRHQSLISATAGDTGNGGNVTLETPILVGLENSDITANAVRGAGGNIQIETQGIFGLENRPQLTPDSDITASSQFGVDGAVNITNPAVDPSSSLVNFSSEPLDPSERVIAGCQWTADSEFVATGRGGIPVNPDRPLTSKRTWADLRDLSEFGGETVSTMPEVSSPVRPLVEANSWVRHPNGAIELVTRSTAPSPARNFPTDCNPLEKS